MDSDLQGHPDMRYDPSIPGIEISTGELGQGLSVGCGIALASRVKNVYYDVYALLGDGEIQEGQIWEAAMTASHHKLDNLCTILDHNKMQIDGTVDEIKSLEPVKEKWEAFGWHVMEIDGHDVKAIIKAYDKAEKIKDKPVFIVAHTIKGKGVSFMEGSPAWHGSVKLRDQELVDALAELGVSEKVIENSLNGSIWRQ